MPEYTAYLTQLPPRVWPTPTIAARIRCNNILFHPTICHYVASTSTSSPSTSTASSSSSSIYDPLWLALLILLICLLFGVIGYTIRAFRHKPAASAAPLDIDDLTSCFANFNINSTPSPPRRLAAHIDILPLHHNNQHQHQQERRITRSMSRALAGH